MEFKQATIIPRLYGSVVRKFYQELYKFFFHWSNPTTFQEEQGPLYTNILSQNTLEKEIVQKWPDLILQISVYFFVDYYNVTYIVCKTVT